MLRKVLMPKLGLTMTEGQIAEWMVAVGAPFKAEDGLFVVETDKVTTEIPAEGDGVLSDIVVQPGQTIKVGEVVAYWNDGGQARTAGGAAVATAEATTTPQAAPAVPAQAPIVSRAPDSSAAASGAERIPITPLARRIAQQLNVDLSAVKGTGPGRRIKADDVRAAAATRLPAGVQPQAQGNAAIDLGTRTAATSVQAATARRLTAVKQQVPHFYLAVEAHVSSLLKLRGELNALNGSVRFTLNHFVVAAAGRALSDLPDANRVWADGEVVAFSSTDVGVAVNTDRGLLVPLIRDAGRLSLTELARRTQAQVERARSGSLSSDDMTGGAVSVSNAGMFDVKFMTPIINPGQAMILGVGSISQVFRPDVEGRPVLRNEMGLVLAGDHRILDGVSGLKFLNRVVAYMEQPLKLLLGE